MNKIITIKFKKLVSIFIFFLILMLLILLSKQNFGCVKSSLNNFLTSIFPSLFPFILFTEIVLKTDILNYISKIFGNILSKIFKIKKSGSSAIIIGFLCGFPMGAKTVSSLYQSGSISRYEANRLLSFVNNCNPAFIISTIGIGVFYDIRIGIILLISHYMSAILIGLLNKNKSSSHIIHENDQILNNFNKKYSKNADNVSFFNILSASIKNTFNTLALILGFIIVFNLLSSTITILLGYFGINPTFISIFSGIIEMTKGIKDIYININLSMELKICIASFMLGFSGFCILFQIFSCLYYDNFKFSNLLKSKIIQGIFSFIITYLLLKYTNIYIPKTGAVFNTVDNYSISQDIYIYNMKLAYLISTLFLVLIILTYCICKNLKQKKQPKVLDHFKY